MAIAAREIQPRLNHPLFPNIRARVFSILEGLSNRLAFADNDKNTQPVQPTPDPEKKNGSASPGPHVVVTGNDLKTDDKGKNTEGGTKKNGK